MFSFRFLWLLLVTTHRQGLALADRPLMSFPNLSSLLAARKTCLQHSPSSSALDFYFPGLGACLFFFTLIPEKSNV